MAPEKHCGDHPTLTADLATAREARRHLELEDTKTAAAVAALELRLQKVEKRLALYSGGLAVLFIVVKVAPSLWGAVVRTASAAIGG